MIKDVIKVKETAFRDKVRVGPGDPVNLKRLLLDLNVLTMYAPMSETFSGMCIKRKNSSFILINSNHSEEDSILQSRMNFFIFLFRITLNFMCVIRALIKNLRRKRPIFLLHYS